MPLCINFPELIMILLRRRCPGFALLKAICGVGVHIDSNFYADFCAQAVVNEVERFCFTCVGSALSFRLGCAESGSHAFSLKKIWLTQSAMPRNGFRIIKCSYRILPGFYPAGVFA